MYNGKCLRLPRGSDPGVTQGGANGRKGVGD